jgi:hypothetical protein
MTSFDNKNAGNEADPFDLDNLRLSQSYIETVGVKKHLMTVPVRKPNPQEFVRVHPDAGMRANFPLIELKEEREEYIVAKELVPELVGEFARKTLYTTISRQGVVLLWPVRLPDDDGRKESEWHRSAREAAELAMMGWIRCKANLSLGAYEVFKAQGCISEPAWPDLNFNQIIRIAFRDRLITSLDHPAIKRLRGLA